MNLPAEPPARVRFGLFEAALREGELLKEGRKVRIQDQPFRILALLVSRPNELVSREDLCGLLWPDGYVDFEHGLNTALNKLRRALGDSAETPRFVETVPRRGYRFIAPVEVVPDASEAPSKPFRRLTRQSLLAAALFVVAVGIGAFLLFADRSKPRLKIAVLPLVNGSGDLKQEYFSDGLTAELIALLGSIAPDRLGVIARTTMMRYKGTDKTADEIAKELGVDYILEGSVRRGKERIRLLVRLIQVSDETQLWSNSYETEPQKIMATQLEVAQRVARSLEVETIPSAEVVRKDAVDPRVFDEYLKGLRSRDLVTEDGFRRALTHFKNAIELEPDFALAYTARASCYCLLSGHALEVDRPQLLMLTAKALAEQALAINPDLAEARGVLGMAKLKYEWDWAGAKRDLSRAVELNPSDPLARIWYAFYLSSQGKHRDAIAQVRAAKDLDPLSRTTNLNLAWQYYEARQYDAALEQFNATLGLFPDLWVAYWGRGLVYCAKRMGKEALADLTLARDASRSSAPVLGSVGYAYAVFGQRSKAEACLKALTARGKTGYVPPTSQVGIYAALGDLDLAFASLEKALQLRSRALVWLAVAHEFDPLRGDSRYEAALKRMGLAK